MEAAGHGASCGTTKAPGLVAVVLTILATEQVLWQIIILIIGKKVVLRQS